MSFKLQIRNFFIHNSKGIVSIKVVLGCFPILFGLSKTFYSKYQDQTFSNLFKHNLPGTSLPQTEISWPTFEQIFSDYLQLDLIQSSISNISNSSVKRVDFYSDSALIQATSKWSTKQKQLYIGVFNNFELNTIKSKKQIGNNWYTIFSKTNKKYLFANNTKYKKNWNICSNYATYDSTIFKNNVFINKFFTNLNKNTKANCSLSLDELPLKLNCNYMHKEALFNNSLENVLPTKVVMLKQKTKVLNFKLSEMLAYDQFITFYENKKHTNTAIKQKIVFSFKQIFFFDSQQFNKVDEVTNQRKNSRIFLKGVQNFIPQIKINSTEKNLLKITKNLSIKKNFLENKFKENFYNKNLLPVSNFSYLNSSVDINLVEKKIFKNEVFLLLESLFSGSWNLDYTEISDLLKFLEEISPFYENNVILPRTMSGYTLPDSTYTNNISLLTQLFYTKNCSLLHTVFPQFFKQLENPIFEINLSKNFSYSLNYLNTKLTRPYFKLAPQSFYVNYYIPENKEKQIYQGFSIDQNNATNDLNLSNFNQVKKWIKQFLNSDTILTDRRETFFGKNIYAEKKNNQEISKNATVNHSFSVQTKLKKISFIKAPLFKKRKVLTFFEMPLKRSNAAARSKNKTKNTKLSFSYKETLKPSSIITYNKYPHLIYLKKHEWNTFFLKFCKNKKKSVPITYIRIPKKKFIVWPLNQLNSKTLSSSVLQDTKKKQINSTITNLKSFIIPKTYHYFPYSQSLAKEILPKKYFFGKVYKKNFSVYKNQKTYQYKPPKFAGAFYESRETINSDSWLVLGQFSIGLLLLQIIQNILRKYGDELKYIISTLLEGKNENSNSIDNTLDDFTSENYSNENFRLIKNIKKNFCDIAGMDAILPELSEIVWFLRNSSRSFKVGNIIPRRILLTGPPGTGKTLLVQVISGESEVPVLIESGSSLNQPGASESSLDRLKNIFNKAREIAPCIIFIDEIDSFGEARDQMLENPITNNEILECLYPNDKNIKKNTFKIENFDFIPQAKLVTQKKILDLNQSLNFQDTIPNSSSNNVIQHLNTKITQKQISKSRSTQQRSNLLMQFLIELDGMTTDKNILVFGATNRPQVLDAALTRPGRFNKILNLNLPNKQKRIEILKLYSQNLGIDKKISWNYLANLTPGLSAADLASVMNQSSMKAIQAETHHTIQTIEYGIESVTGYSSQKNMLKSFTQSTKNAKKAFSKSFFINRLAYYQAGKAIVHSLLEYHPKVISIHLWPQLKNSRYHLVNGIIEKEFSQIRTRVELESRLVGFYGGKAAELLALFHGFKNLTFSLQEKTQTKKSTNHKQLSKHKQFFYLWQSDLGIQDITFAGWLAQLMINKWYFYSKQVSIKKKNLLQNNSNIENIPDNGMLELFNQLSHEVESKIKKETSSIQENSQNWIIKPWLQKQITQKLEFSYSSKNNWYKIYEGDHEKNENTKCILPDEYYHNNTYLRNLLNNKVQMGNSLNLPVILKKNRQQSFLKSSLTWNDIPNLNRNSIYHSLILTCFNKSIFILDNNRELLDFFASYLTQKEIIREHEVLTIINTFHKNEINFTKKQNPDLGFKTSFTRFFEKKSKIQNQTDFESDNRQISNKFKIKKKYLAKNWSKLLKKKKSRFIYFSNT